MPNVVGSHLDGELVGFATKAAWQLPAASAQDAAVLRREILARWTPTVAVVVEGAAASARLDPHIIVVDEHQGVDES